MKILLISANTEMINMPVLPMGLACVAASARNAGHEVKLLNLMTCQDTGSLIQTAIAESSPDLIGISVRNIDDQIRDQPRFLLLFSEHSLSKGFFQKEQRIALELRDELPLDRIYTIPVKLDNTEPTDGRVKGLYPADFSKDYQQGFNPTTIFIR